MNKKTYFTYSFDELSKEGKQKAINNYRDINTDHDFWYEDIIKEWEEKLKRQGFEDSKIYFTGFYNQGDGASFECTINLKQFLKGRRIATKYKKDLKKWTDEEFNITIKKAGYPHYSHEYMMNFVCYEDISQELEMFILEEAMEQARKIYNELRTCYEFLMEDQQVIDTFYANEYEFTEDGRID